MLIIGVLLLYQRSVLSNPARVIHAHWQAIMSEDFQRITHQYDTNAVLIWNDCKIEEMYLGTQISDNWRLFFRENAIDAYAVNDLERDRRMIKAKIVATARSSKGNVQHIYISHKMSINARGKIVRESWTASRRK